MDTFLPGVGWGFGSGGVAGQWVFGQMGRGGQDLKRMEKALSLDSSIEKSGSVMLLEELNPRGGAEAPNSRQSQLGAGTTA